MRKAAANPSIFTSRKKGMLTTGVLDLNGECTVDLAKIPPKSTELIKELNLSFTPLSSLAGLPRLPKLERLILDNSYIENFTNIEAVSGVSNISLYNTPVSRVPHFKLSLLIVCGNNLRVIDRCTVSEKLRDRAESYPPIAKELVNHGWMAEYPCPDASRFKELCDEFGVEYEEEAKSGDYVSQMVPERDIEEIIAKYSMQHMEMLRQAEEIMAAPIEDVNNSQIARIAFNGPLDQDDELVSEGTEVFEEEDEEDESIIGFNPNLLSYRIQEVLKKYGFEIDDTDMNIEAVISALEHVFELAEGKVEAFPEIDNVESSECEVDSVHSHVEEEEEIEPEEPEEIEEPPATAGILGRREQEGARVQFQNA